MIRSNYVLLICVGILFFNNSYLSAQSDEPAIKKSSTNNFHSDGILQKNRHVSFCNSSIICEDSIIQKNTVEYYLNNGIIYIREYYADKKLKSESYWVDDIIPVYQIKQYNQQGEVSKIIDKSIGKYDLCYVLDKIQSLKELEGKQYSIGLSNNANNFENRTWIITFNDIEHDFSSSGDEIFIDPKTGRIEESRFSISAQPANIIEPTPDQLPTFPGDLKAFERNIANHVDIPQDSIRNTEVYVRYSVDTYGKVDNFQAMGGTTYLKNEVLKLAKQMPDWKAAKDHQTDGASNVEGDDFGKYLFGFSVYFRRFD